METLEMEDDEMTGLQQPRTLIADDQADVLAALHLLLKGEGFQTDTVDSPEAVLKALSTKEYDLLLMDLNYTRDTTSGKEGLDLLSRIAKRDDALPIVVMTAWGSIDLAVEVMQQGVGDFVQKPWDNAQLLKILRKQIQQGKIERKKRRLESGRQVIVGKILEAQDQPGMLRDVAEQIRHTLQNRSVTIFSKGPGNRACQAKAREGVAAEFLGRLDFNAYRLILARLGPVVNLLHERAPGLEKLVEGDGSTALIVPVLLGDEPAGFISLGTKISAQEYDAAELEFITSVAEQLGAGVDRLLGSRQEQEVEEAREIQQSLLPKEIPQVAGFQIGGTWHPARAVGGDYYDVFRVGESSVALCIGDVSGKGMPAALLMSNLQASVRAFAVEGVDPRELCEKVNRVVYTNIAANKFITFSYCLLDTKTRRMGYANAGHSPPILVRRQGTCLRLPEGGALLGVFPEWDYRQGEIDLERGDRLLLCTDGLTEAKNEEDEEFGDDRLIQVLHDHRHLTPDVLQNKVMQAVLQFSGGNLEDDATLIILAVD
jgi:FixJ family two-component response regulator